MSTDKKLIERNLSLSDTYTFEGATYIPVIEGGGTCCENCGKLISNIATIKNQHGRAFNVGLDCAETLTISNKWDFECLFKSAISEGKRIRAKILKHLKSGSITMAYKYTSNDSTQFVVYRTKSGGSGMEKILFPDITLKYIESLLSAKPAQ